MTKLAFHKMLWAAYEETGELVKVVGQVTEAEEVSS
jgi:hypothetical protein